MDAVLLPHTLEFEPAGLWALRHRLSRGGFPPGLHRTPSRLRRAQALERHKNPLKGRFGSVYLIKAKKRVYTLTPIRSRRRRRPALVGAAVENA